MSWHAQNEQNGSPAYESIDSDPVWLHLAIGLFLIVATFAAALAVCVAFTLNAVLS